MSSSSTQQPAAKRARYTAKMVQMAVAKSEKPKDYHVPVRTVVHSWGNNAFLYFPGQPRSTPLWQVQVMHEMHDGIAYMLSAAIKDALPKFKDGKALTLEAMEKVHSIKCTNTGGKGDNFDKDGAGLQQWRNAIYVAGPTCHAALELVQLVAQQKVESGQLIVQPPLQIIDSAASNPLGSLPAGWIYKQVLDAPGPFAACPPKGRKHLWMQVETCQSGSEDAKEADTKEEGEEEEEGQVTPPTPSWNLLFYGGIYEYRELFEAQNIEGAYVGPEGASKEFVRSLPVDMSSKETILHVLGEGVFQHAPVLLVNATEAEDDPMVNWLLDQRSVHLHEERES